MMIYNISGRENTRSGRSEDEQLSFMGFEQFLFCLLVGLQVSLPAVTVFLANLGLRGAQILS